MGTIKIFGWVVILLLVTEPNVRTLNASKLPETTKTTLIYNETPASWNEAISTCNKMGGVLANVQDEVKFAAVTESLYFVDLYRNGSTAEEIWIGLHVGANKSSHFWSTCEAMSSSFQKWDHRITENNDTQDCTAMNKTSELWMPRKCNETKPFLCETFKECGCSMDVHDECADLTRTQYVNLTTSSLRECINLCLDYVSNSDQCWSISYFVESNTCQVHEKAGNYKSTCSESEPVHHYHKNCYGVSISNLYNADLNQDAEPVIDCTLAEKLTTSEKVCNFSAEAEITSPRNDVTETSTDNLQSNCTCTCTRQFDSSNTLNLNMTLSQQLEWLRATLSIDRKETTLVRRSKISASDDRVSAQGLGYAGGFILLIFLGGIISLDISRLFKDLQLGFRRCRGRLKILVRSKAK